MELNEIKKALYKQNVNARLVNVRKDGIVYETYADVLIPEHQLYESEKITFLVPLNEIGDVIFETFIPAKLLIRYIVQ